MIMLLSGLGSCGLSASDTTLGTGFHEKQATRGDALSARFNWYAWKFPSLVHPGEAEITQQLS